MIMTSNDKFKNLILKLTCHYFDNIININGLNLNDILIDEK